jgi:integrase
VSLKENTMSGYKQKIKAYLNFCEKNFYDNVFDKEALEQYIMQMWRKGNKKQSPEGFRSALRKACCAGERPDPFSNKLNLMVNAFSVDFPKPKSKFIMVNDLSKLSDFVMRSNRAEWRDVLELMFFSIWQNVRISTLLEIKWNDIFVEDGAIFLEFVKGHRGPIWTILHPIAERIAQKRRKKSNGGPNERLVGSWEELSLNQMLSKMCAAAGIPAHTWHDLRHTGTQYMNDLDYANDLLQALGTWKVCYSMKTYVRDRKGLLFSKETWALHKEYKASLSERLRKLHGRMKWLPVRDRESSVFGERVVRGK